MDTSLIVTIAVIVFLVIFMIAGAYKGFLRVVLSAASLIVTLMLAGTFARPLADFVNNSTAIGSGVSQKIEDYIYSVLNPLTDDAASAQEKIIDSLPLPQTMKEDLLTRYGISSESIGTENFAKSLASSLSDMVLRMLSFILLFIVIFLIMRLIMRLSNLFNHIPVLGGINRFFGAVLGLAEGVIFLWIACMIIMLMSGRPAGIACEEVIRGSTFLTFIYEHNYLLAAVNGILGLFRIKV